MNERFINEVAVSVVFVNGPTEELKLSATEILEGAAEIQDGHALLTNLEPDAEISWNLDYKIIDLDQPIFPTAPWKGLPKDFYIAEIDAVLWRESNQRTYIFQGDQYVRLNGTEAESGYPRTIAGNWHSLPVEFEAGIDAAFLRKSDGKIYMFKDAQYVRLTDTTVDADHPKPIAGNWHGLPADFETGIDAAFCHGDTGHIYMFKGDQYVRLTGTTVDPDYPKPIKGNFKGVPDYYEDGISAAFWRGDNEKTYLFGRKSRNNLNTYVRFTDIQQPVDEGYPEYMGGLDADATEALWRDLAQVELGVAKGADGYKQHVENLVKKLGTDWGVIVFVTKYPTYWAAYAGTPKVVMRWKVGGDNFDRVLAHETGHTFGAPDEYAASECDCSKTYGRFFDVKNGNCALCASTLSMSDGYPKPIAGSWHGLPADFQAGIDAAVWRADVERAYMFKGNRYVRMKDATVEANYPKPIAGNWHGLPADFEAGVDAALYRASNSKLYFFKGSRYVRMSGTTVDTGYPRPIAGNWKGLSADFEAGIDAALWRTANGKIYFFKGNKYCRLTETTVDDDYPKPIAGNWKGLPSAFTSDLDAAMMHDGRNAIYLFKGSEYVRMTNGVPCLMSSNGPVVCEYTPAHLGWEAFLTGIDAALHRGDNNKSYLFSGKWYVRYDKIGEGIEDGYPMTIAASWHGLPADFEAGIDAALWRPSNGKTYLFKGGQYVRLTGSTVDDGYPRSIAGNWHGLPASFESGIDAALWRKSNDKIYFFKGDQYVRLTETTVDDGYPRPIADWTGMPAPFATKIDAALMQIDTNQIYFFHGRKYLRYSDVDKGPDDGYPKWIDKHWMPFPRG